VDVTVVNAAAPSYNSKASVTPLSAALKEQHKLKKYQSQVEAEGGVFFPLVWEVNGAYTSTVKRLLDMFTDTADVCYMTKPPSRKFMLDYINHGIQTANAKINARGLRFMKRNLELKLRKAAVAEAK
jgi:hypothetical protein